MPALSVVLPVFNGGSYLEEAILSIRNQSFKDFEFIIVNDGSTDQSLDFIKRHAYEDARIVVIDRENRGLVTSLNEGVNIARGELIARMDADDVALADRLSNQYEYMCLNSGVVAAGTGYLLIDEDGDPIRIFRPLTNDPDLQQQGLQRYTPICHPTAIFRKKEFLEVGGYREVSMLAEDLDLWLRMGELGKLGNLSDVLVKYRQHSASLSESKQLQQLAVMHRVVLEAYERRGLSVEGNLSQPLMPWRSTGSEDDNYSQLIRYGWWAWSEGYSSTAQKYAARAVVCNPLNKEGWMLLYCAWLRKNKNQFD